VAIVVSTSIAVWPRVAPLLHWQSHTTAVAAHAAPSRTPTLAAKIAPESLLDRQFMTEAPRPRRVVAPSANLAPPAPAPAVPAPSPPRLRDRIVQKIGPLFGRLG
jgi:hypothetical protein